jgi:hypothetical protein
MSDPGDQGSGEGSSAGAAGFGAADAFALLGHEVRREILVTLSDPDEDDLNPPELPFSTLYDRVDADVDTSQFNYHLQQLVGPFVEARDDGTDHHNEDIASHDGYALRPAGLHLVWSIRSVTTQPADAHREPFPAGFDCHHCGTPATAEYRHGIFCVRCPDCGYHYEYNLTPPGVVHDADGGPAADDADDGPAIDDAILERVAAYNRTQRSAVARGVCPICAGGLAHRFVDAAETNYPRADLRSAFVHAECGHCDFLDYLTVGEYLLDDPALVAFGVDHGLNVTEGPIWEREFAATDDCVSIEARNPWSVAFELERDGDELEVQLDETLAKSVTVRD